MWKPGLMLSCALAALPAHADLQTGNAMVIGNARYGESTIAFGADEVQAVARALRLRGQEVAALANGGPDLMALFFDAFVASIDSGETPLIVVLSGKFARGSDGPVLLPAWRGEAPSPERGLSLSAVLEVLGQSPHRAFLVLGEAGQPPDFATRRRSVLEDMQSPPGVTVIRGPAKSVARFAAREMAQPGARLARTAADHDLGLAGHLTDRLVVLAHTEVRPPTRAEQTAARGRARQLDDQAWQSARRMDTADAYRAYLDSFPEGRHLGVASGRANESALALDLDARKAIQRDLARLGYRTRGVDGLFGPATRQAIAAWQELTGGEATGYLDARQVAQIAREAAARTGEAPSGRSVAVSRDREAVVARPSVGEAAVWNRARGEDGLRRYLQQFPQGAYADRARVLLGNSQRGVRP